jgi:hypothetical protein
VRPQAAHEARDCDRVIGISQVHELAAALPERYSAIVYLAAGCGLRGAEITGLELESVDFLQRQIDVSQQLVCVTGVEPYLGPPKTRGQLAQSRCLRSRTRRWRGTSSYSRRPKSRSGIVLTLTSGSIIGARLVCCSSPSPDGRSTERPGRISGRQRPVGRESPGESACTACGTTSPRSTGFHHGAGVKRVQLALGHSTPMITLNTYAGEWPDTDDQARVIVDSVLGNVPCVCPVRRAAR